jgi:hypothetical protein
LESYAHRNVFLVKQMTIVYISNKKKRERISHTHTHTLEDKKNKKIEAFVCFCFSLPRTKKTIYLTKRKKKSSRMHCIKFVCMGFFSDIS